MKKRFVDNWLSTVAGIAIMTLGALMFYQAKIDYVAFGIIEALGAAMAGIKYKKEI
jgi:hypothetical protein